MSYKAFQVIVLAALSLLLFLASAILATVVQTDHRQQQPFTCYDAGFDTARCVPGDTR